MCCRFGLPRTDRGDEGGARAPEDPHPQLHVGPLALPLLPGLRRREHRHLLAVQFQDAGAVVPHDLGNRGGLWGRLRLGGLLWRRPSISRSGQWASARVCRALILPLILAENEHPSYPALRGRQPPPPPPP